MSSNARSHEQKNRFMEDTANLYGFSGKKWDVFLNRFSKEREGQAHNTIADSLWTEEVVDPRQTFRDHLKSICDQFVEKGCPGVDSKNRPRGRPPSKESPWRIAYKWLWDTKFPEWQEQDTQSTAVETVRPKWQKVCREMLEQGKRLTINELMAKDGIRVNPDELFVPIGLVERRQKRYRRFDVDSAEQGSSLLKPEQEEIVQRFDNLEAFFDQAISDPDIPMGYRMAITGHPGGGKTSLLQKLGDLLHQKSVYPIWISLAKISAKPLREYLFDDWLREAAGSALAAPSDWQADLDSLIKTGKVWLLLDGADEIASDSPLGHMRSVFQEEWAKQVQVVLTCRLSAWDTNALSDFKVYRTLEFDYHTPVKEVLQEYPNQVEAFIHKFFARPDANPQSGRDLIQQLYAPGKERIRDSVKNPLRLTLLCYVWETGLGSLPNTKAELYRLFVDYYYDLQVFKHPETRIDRTVRNFLNRKLGEVAIAALDSRDSRFCLRKSLITSIEGFGEPDTKDSLFWKALQLNWLNYIGTTAEKPFEDAYAFFHPTFQEYFAALAIDDPTYFLDRNTNGFSLDDKQYLSKVLEKLTHPWLQDNPSEEQIEESIEGFFYFSMAKNFIDSITRGNYRVFEDCWREVILIWFGRSNLIIDQKKLFIDSLLSFKDYCSGFYGLKAFFIAAEAISEFSHSEHCDEIVQKLTDLAFGNYDDSISSWLGTPYPINREAQLILTKTDYKSVITRLESMLDICTDEVVSWEICKSLREIEPGNPKIITTLKNLFLFSENIDAIYLSLESLEDIIRTDRKLISILFDALSLRRDTRISEDIREVIQRFETQENYARDEENEISLKVDELDDPKVVCELVETLRDNKNRWECMNAVSMLEDVLLKSLLGSVVQGLKDCFLEQIKEDDSWRSSYCFQIMWHCAQNMSYLEFWKAWHCSSYLIIQNLMKMDDE